jgi:peroxiredoxin
MAKRSVFIPVLLGLGALLFLSGGLNDLQAQGKKFIQKGDAFPEIALKTPSQPKDRTYLGISGGDQFKVKDLKAEVILVEIFDVYCLPCQKQAPLYKQLFGMIQSNPAARDKIKMIGIAVGNDASEIKKFQDHFQVPYPIISDPKFILHAAVGGPPAPFSVIVRGDPGGKSALVADAHLGFNKDIEGLFKQLLSLARSVSPTPSPQSKKPMP